MPGGFTQDSLPTSGIGCTDIEVIDVSDKNAIPEVLNCRFFHVDVSGIVKIDFRDDTGKAYQ